MAPRPKIEYEWGGPLGGAALVTLLPVLLMSFTVVCNDVSGCPAPVFLEPKSFTWAKFVAQTPWPENGLRGLVDGQVCAVVLGYYLLSLILFRILPAKDVYGTKLVLHEKPLKYRFNSFSSAVLQIAACGVGTYVYGADFIVWRYISDNFLQMLVANLLIAYILSIVMYLNSFNVPPAPNPAMREFARGGNTGNMIYDFWIGRELNPRVTLPFFGEIDIKTWCEMRPGLTGWVLFNLAFAAKQYRNFGYVSDSMVLVILLQGYYVMEGLYFEEGILSMMDITTDGFGFMLCFGDLAWVPFLYSTQTRYLSVYPVSAGWLGTTVALSVFGLGLYIFRAANTQKNTFRRNPDDPAVKGLSFIQTKRGTKLLTSGWWGAARHVNYFGDWMQSLPFSVPTGVAGYLILPAGSAVAQGAMTMLDGRQVVQGEARSFGMIFTYFYVIYFGILLMHREGRDDKACQRKYGADWDEYKRQVPSRIVPGIY